ncbi:hypothetical protein M231_06298 [Tremella mesenterica]|uniref:RINT-1 family protein n=1 Tax=Tremella mesenterica TaxID=5217 RepID=A0A4Q1BEF5_TREME|nr:uncharacterized protein TREMEDRAFT_73946 [Tremella mesenterica DSM 1558]EIW69690.1 hypothetical protein TREMEDRAFT_73946 [Tremella mesenterica DSM 1558]RXK36454.1 hypothetical protein M231_06298 [Tremella mesenterica]
MSRNDNEVAQRILVLSAPLDVTSVQLKARIHLDENYTHLEFLHPPQAGPSTPRSHLNFNPKKRSLNDEITYWENKEAITARELEETSKILPGLLDETQTRLQTFLSSAQDLSLKRYALADQLVQLLSDLSSSSGTEKSEDEELRRTVLDQMKGLQAELTRLEAGLSWIQVLEKLLILRDQILNQKNHHPSPLAALPKLSELNDMVKKVQDAVPGDMTLLRSIVDVRDEAWKGLKDVMTQQLLEASETLSWPLKTDYPAVPPHQRRTFERCFQDLLYLQIEGERMGLTGAKTRHWSSGQGLFSIQAMIRPIELRFKYHFQGSKSTNRVDKPEWAFSNILDQIYQHTDFISDYLQPLVSRSGSSEVDVKSEFTLLLFPVLLNLLRTRIPRLLDSPALLAHTIYQTIIFDDAIRDMDFDLGGVSVSDGSEKEWEGLAGVILKENGWFEQWLEGERTFAEGQLNEIISSPDAWTIEDPPSEDERGLQPLRPTQSARQVKALIEQIQERYSPLPALENKIPFLTTIQLPLLSTYHRRISSSLDAFESVSSAFVRAVPGALANSRSGIVYDQSALTAGKQGLERLLKGLLSVDWVLEALKGWADDPFYVELTGDIQTSSMRWKLQSEPLLPSSLLALSDPSQVSVFDVIIDQYQSLHSRAEDMIVRLVTMEVENDLKEHLKRRWDPPTSEHHTEPDSSLSSSLTTYTSHLTCLHLLPPVQTSSIYRRIVNHLVNHISQRAVYAGWSKFTSQGGRDLYTEIEDWVQAGTCLSHPEEGIPMEMVKAPWNKLMDMAKVLSLPTESEVSSISRERLGSSTGVRGGEEDQRGRHGAKGEEEVMTFENAVDVAWGDEDVFERFKSKVGITIMREEVQGVLKRRVEWH